MPAEVLEVDRELPAGLLRQEGGTHADEGETSMMLSIAPEMVRMSKAVKVSIRPGRHGDEAGGNSFQPTGVYGDPTLATRTRAGSSSKPRSARPSAKSQARRPEAAEPIAEIYLR
jgi:creatinine amidohydrolase/Fe(II)-dependent formamide hydrolase-like protein